MKIPECSVIVLPVGGSNKGLALGNRGAELCCHSKISWTPETKTKTGHTGALACLPCPAQSHLTDEESFTERALQRLCTVVCLCVHIQIRPLTQFYVSSLSQKDVSALQRGQAQIDSIHRNTHTDTHRHSNY